MKIKRFFLSLLLAVVVCMGAWAQNSLVQQVGNLDGAAVTFVPKSLLTMALGDSTVKAQTQAILNNVETVMLVQINKKGTAKKARKLLEKIPQSNAYDLMLQQKQAQGNQSVTVYAAPRNAPVLNEVIVIVEKDKKTLAVIDITGTFNKQEIAESGALDKLQ